MVAQCEVGLDPPLERRDSKLLEASALAPRERLRELGQRRAAPERERFAQLPGRPRRFTFRERNPALVEQALEARQVELLFRDLEP